MNGLNYIKIKKSFIKIFAITLLLPFENIMCHFHIAFETKITILIALIFN